MSTNTKKLNPQIGQIEVSIYTSGQDAKSRRYIRLQEVVDIIVSGRPLIHEPSRSIKDLQIEARYKKMELPHREYQDWKSTHLPMFLVTGCYETRKNNGLLGPHTGLVSIDIDHIDNIEALRNRIIANEPALVMAGISPSGDGLKLFFQVTPVPTDAAEHRIIATQLQDYLAKQYSIPITTKDSFSGIDREGTRMTFTCFFFHDENLYVNTNLPTKFKGNLTQLRAPKTLDNNEPLDEFDWNKLNDCLKHYTADCTYPDWISIGMAMKHEGVKRDLEDTFFKRWDEWSQESETKYDASKMEDKWISFNKDNADQITLGSIYAQAKEEGWNPPADLISEKTAMNRRSLESAELERYEIEQNMPLHLRSQPPEDADIARIVNYCADKLLIVNNKDIYIRTMAGSWDKIELERPNGRVDYILKYARDRALEDISNHEFGGQEYKKRLDTTYRSTNSHIKALTGRLLSLIENDDIPIKRIKMSDFNNRVVFHPTLALERGGIDLTNGKILSPEEYSTFNALQSDTWAVEYDPTILDHQTHGCIVAKHLIEDHYGTELISRLAYHLVYPGKSVDIINIPTSSAGKTALAEWLKASIGSVGIDSRARSLTSKADQYTQATAPLTEYLLYFYDEVDKSVDEISIGVINEMTSEDLTISKKYQNPTPLPRIGTGILTGADWPPIDTTAQGIDTRITFVYFKELPKMSSEVKRTLQTDTDAHKYLLAWIVRECVKHYENSLIWTNSEGIEESRARFFTEQTPEDKRLLMETYETSESEADCIPIDHIKLTLGIASDNRAHLSKLVQAVFPRTRKKYKTMTYNDETKKTYVFNHLKIKPDGPALNKNIEAEIENILEA